MLRNPNLAAHRFALVEFREFSDSGSTQSWRIKPIVRSCTAWLDFGVGRNPELLANGAEVRLSLDLKP
jgi:hypothetical protein